MREYAPLLSLMLVGYAAAATPGPTFLMLSQIAVTRSRLHAIAAVLGVVTSGIIWSVGTLSGLSLLFAWMPVLQWALRIAGGLYLLYLGVQFWLHARDRAESLTQSTGARTLHAAYLRGFLTDFLNPKCLLFFGSIFSVFIRPDAPDAVRLGAVLCVVAVGLSWYGLVALAFSTDAARRLYLSWKACIARLSGTVMFGFGIKLLLMRA